MEINKNFFTAKHMNYEQGFIHFHYEHYVVYFRKIANWASTVWGSSVLQAIEYKGDYSVIFLYCLIQERVDTPKKRFVKVAFLVT